MANEKNTDLKISGVTISTDKFGQLEKLEFWAESEYSLYSFTFDNRSNIYCGDVSINDIGSDNFIFIHFSHLLKAMEFFKEISAKGKDELQEVIDQWKLKQ